MNLQIGSKVYVDINEPAEFFLAAGECPFPAFIESAKDDAVELNLGSDLNYKGHQISHCRVSPRYKGQNFTNLKKYSSITVNLVFPNEIPGLTHFIGEIHENAL